MNPSAAPHRRKGREAVPVQAGGQVDEDGFRSARPRGVDDMEDVQSRLDTQDGAPRTLDSADLTARVC